MGERPRFGFSHAAFEPETVTLGRDDQYREFRFDLCRAIDMTKVSIVLGKMVEAGVLDKRMAELFHGQASTLLALMVSENNRSFLQSTREEARP